MPAEVSFAIRIFTNSVHISHTAAQTRNPAGEVIDVTISESSAKARDKTFLRGATFDNVPLPFDFRCEEGDDTFYRPLLVPTEREINAQSTMDVFTVSVRPLATAASTGSARAVLLAIFDTRERALEFASHYYCAGSRSGSQVISAEAVYDTQRNTWSWKTLSKWSGWHINLCLHKMEGSCLRGTPARGVPDSESSVETVAETEAEENCP